MADLSIGNRSPASERGFAALAASQGARLRVLPMGFLSAGGAERAIGQGMALPLAGGPRAFMLAEIVVRGDAGQSRSALFSLTQLKLWRDQNPDLTDPVNGVLDRLSRKRPAWAGLGLDRVVVMGILNVTPDSFSDGGCYVKPAAAIAQGKSLLEAGADIIDVGGESTRPGATPVDAREQIRRILPVVTALANLGAVVSIDTSNAEVMEAGLAAGARIVNDVTALTGDPESLRIVTRRKASIVLMHMLGDPRMMQTAPAYRDVVLDVVDYLEARLSACLEAGVPLGNIAIDPGLGFGKTVDHNLTLLARLGLFHGLGAPLLIGASRKSFIGALSRREAPADRLPGSLAAVLDAVRQGAQILRVHDVAETRQALAVFDRPPLVG